MTVRFSTSVFRGVYLNRADFESLETLLKDGNNDIRIMIDGLPASSLYDPSMVEHARNFNEIIFYSDAFKCEIEITKKTVITYSTSIFLEGNAKIQACNKLFATRTSFLMKTAEGIYYSWFKMIIVVPIIVNLSVASYLGDIPWQVGRRLIISSYFAPTLSIVYKYFVANNKYSVLTRKHVSRDSKPYFNAVVTALISGIIGLILASTSLKESVRKFVSWAISMTLGV